MAGTFHVNVVTPESPVADEEVRHASFPAWDGQIGVLHNRAPLVAKLGHGRLTLDLAGGGSRELFVSGGFVQMKDNRLSVLTDLATPVDTLTKAEAEAALREAQSMRGGTPLEAERKDRELARARAMVAVAPQ